MDWLDNLGLANSDILWSRCLLQQEHTLLKIIAQPGTYCPLLLDRNLLRTYNHQPYQMVMKHETCTTQARDLTMKTMDMSSCRLLGHADDVYIQFWTSTVISWSRYLVVPSRQSSLMSLSSSRLTAPEVCHTFLHVCKHYLLVAELEPCMVELLCRWRRWESLRGASWWAMLSEVEWRGCQNSCWLLPSCL